MPSCLSCSWLRLMFSSLCDSILIIFVFAARDSFYREQIPRLTQYACSQKRKVYRRDWLSWRYSTLLVKRYLVGIISDLSVSKHQLDT